MQRRHPGSLRARLLAASLLWTAGLLALMHMISLVLLHALPGLRRTGALFPAMLGVGLMAAGFAVGRRALAPVAGLRDKLAAVRGGSARRLAGEYPAEVEPLIGELNQLLEDRERAVERASAAAGDLAHGLKTPLALIAQEAARVEREGHTELAASLVEQVDRMTRLVNYQLARARASAAGRASTPPLAMAPAVDALIRTLAKLHAARSLALTAAAPPDLAVRVEPGDLDEIAGNLLDNACKWARSSVTITARVAADDRVELTVEDDGPGLSPDLRDAVLRRGVRADQAAPGSGLGLAIVRDLVELYGGTVTLGTAQSLGGLRVSVSLPRA